MSAMVSQTGSADDANATRRPVKTSWSRVSHSSGFLDKFRVDPIIVYLVPVAHRQVHLNVAPVKPATQPKMVASKGKAVYCPTTRSCVHKVTRIATPMLEVAEVEVPP